jgi:hypothetical protein
LHAAGNRAVFLSSKRDNTAHVTATTFAPGRDVRRDQMASFLTRLLDRLVEEGAATLPT